MGVTHAFVSEVADGTDETIVRPSNWNDGHVVDVDLTSEVSGVLPIENGGVARAMQSFVAQTSVTVNHNSGAFVSVDVIDSGGNRIIPNTEVHDTPDFNSFTITFTDATTGTVFYF